MQYIDLIIYYSFNICIFYVHQNILAPLLTRSTNTWPFFFSSPVKSRFIDGAHELLFTCGFCRVCDSTLRAGQKINFLFSGLERCLNVILDRRPQLGAGGHIRGEVSSRKWKRQQQQQ